MKKLVLLIFVSFISCAVQNNSVSEIEKFQKELNDEYKNPKESPLRGENFSNFKNHPFFPINLKYRVTAKFTKTENAEPFLIPTSSGHKQPYVEYGKVSFILDGKTYSLNIYQNLSLIKKEGYADHLFLPFHDATNGNETYGGGKYMDLKTPKSSEMVLDFNQSYQPFCAYNAYEYSCPIVPQENTLPIRIEAGVKYDDSYFH